MLCGNRQGGCHNATPAKLSPKNAPRAPPCRMVSRTAAVLRAPTSGTAVVLAGVRGQPAAAAALADTVAECIDAAVFRAEDPMHVAGVLWAATHGAVSLELAGYEGAVDAEHRFDDVCAATAAWFMTRRP